MQPLAELLRSSLAKYSEDQPRDDRGRWTAGESARFEGRAPTITGSMPVTIVNPHVNAAEVTRTDKSGREYAGATPHIRQVEVETARGKRHVVPEFTLSRPKPQKTLDVLDLLKAKLPDTAAHEAATSPLNLRPQPTEGQRSAGNYKKGHTSVAGIPITIENPAGSRRRPEWPPMTAHYGYIKGTDGADGDQVDVFVRPGTANDWAGDVYVVNQLTPDGRFDEHKAMVGWPDERSATRDYAANYQRGWRVGPVTAMSNADFKRWVLDGDHKSPLRKFDPLGQLRKYSEDQPRDDRGRWTNGAGDEQNPGTAPAIGQKFTVFRLGSGEEDLTSRNAGNAESVANHIARIEDNEGPANVAGSGNVVTAYEVTPHESFGSYQQYIGGKATGVTHAGEQAATIGRSVTGDRVAYSFPKGSKFTATKTGSVSVADLHSALKQRGHDNFDMAGYGIGAQVIREAFSKPAKSAAVSDLQKYSPDQPRDERGRWTTGEGGGGQASASTGGGLGGGGAVEARLVAKLGMEQVGDKYVVTDKAAFQKAVDEYYKLAEADSPGLGDRILNTDIARELSPDYLADRSLSAAVHEPASAFIKELYAQKLAAATPAGMAPVVLFTAGGTGAGKSTGMRLEGIREQVAAADIIYDTNMNTYGSSERKVQQALDSGRSVAIVYTHRDATEALVSGALPRAMKQEQKYGTGRTVPIEEHAKTHEGALPTVKALQQKYAGTGRLVVAAVDNSRGFGKAAVVDVNTLVPQQVNRQALYDALKAEHKAGRISNRVYSGFAGSGH